MFYTHRFIFSLFLVLQFCATRSFAQKIIIGDDSVNRPLTWADFTGKPDPQSKYMANTGWEIKMRYTMEASSTSDDIKCDFNITLLLGYDSWVKADKKTDHLLAHEQRHFDIAILCLREVVRELRAETYKKTNYRDKIASIYNGTVEKYKRLQREYDEQTAHSMNKEQQKEWDEFIKKELKKTAPASKD